MKRFYNRPKRVGWAILGGVGLFVSLIGAGRSHAAETYSTVRIDGVPQVRQEPDFCGEACAEMALRKLGRNFDQNAVFNQSGLDPALGRGCYTGELARALEKIGFDIAPIGEHVAAKHAPAELEKSFAAMHADLLAGVPTIVCMHYDDRPNTTEHFRLVLGYDAATDEILYNEPAEADGAYRRMARKMFLKLWPLKYSTESWTVIRMPLRPGKLLERPEPLPAGARFTAADYVQHILRLKQSLPADGGFCVVLSRPFVVIGNESPAAVEQHSTQTVQWAVERIKRSYFSRDPEKILDIWLFKDKETYEKHATDIFGDTPNTPFGYFSAAHGALIMNIATGGGTLVHEIVHPYMAANFPQCPSWFNEGLASLYEHAGEVDGRIHGYPNWRLPGLQRAIKAHRVPSFETLCSTTTDQFYQQDPGTNYSQARYLCYYLQEKGLLEKYYRRFRANATSDPEGYKTLKEVLGVTDMAAFQKEWEAYVMKLKVS